MDARLHSRLSPEPLSWDAARAFVADPGAGGIVLFAGVVRDHAEGEAVTGLDYEAYEDEAQRLLDELAVEVATRWPVRAVWMEHRVGSLAVGEDAVVVAVSAPHRQAAFEAGRYAIDTLKAGVPIWKHEHFAAGGSHWPGTQDTEAGAGARRP